LALGVFGGVGLFYCVLWTGSSFDPIATFQSAWRNKHNLLAKYHDQRPYPATILFDLTDFAFAMGWVGAVIGVMGLISAMRDATIERPKRLLVAACIAQPIIVSVTGVLQSETLRVWNFMLPLAAIAGGGELARWRPPSRAIAYALLFVVMLIMEQNLQL
jgi:hypothetical protein